MPTRTQAGGEGTKTKAQVKAEAEAIAEKNAPRIAAVLGIRPRSVPIRIVSPRKMQQLAGEAYAGIYDPTTDSIAITYWEGDLGRVAQGDWLEELVIHEMTHATLAPHQFEGQVDQGSEKNRTLLVEGLADYTVNTVLQQTEVGPGDPRDGYQAGAGFFQYMEQERPGSVKEVVAQVSRGDATPFPETTGRTYGQWAREYAKTGVGDMRPIKELQKIGYADENGNVRVPEGGDYSLLWNPQPAPRRLGPHYAEGMSDPADGGWDAANVRAARMAMRGGVAPMGIEINLPGNGGGGGGGGDGGGGGGGGSSGGSSAPAVDPIVARRMAAYQTVYQSIWGEPADEAYLKSAANQGLNVWEFAYQERTKPAFFGSKVYNDKADQWVSLLKSLGVG